MFQRIEKLNVFGIADDIVIGVNDVDSRDNDRTLRHVMLIYCQENVKLNKNLCFFKAEKRFRILKEQKNILVEDKLLPVFQHGFLRSEENVDHHNLSESV